MAIEKKSIKSGAWNVIFILLIGTACREKSVKDGGYVDLFDGQTLNGWKVLEGPSDFQAVDGTIVSTTRMDMENGYLCTDEEFDNFILELDVKIDTVLNSGVQIRSRVWQRDTTTDYTSAEGKRIPTPWKAGMVWGYQVEVDPSARAWSGGLYECNNRGWLVTLAGKEEARRAFKPLHWNHMKIEANGSRIKTWINGIAAVDTIDTLSSTGFIGLQFHKAYQEVQAGKTVRWRNIRIHRL